MSERSTQSAANALLRLLHELNLIPTTITQQKIADRSELPILALSNLGLLDQQEALTKVAQKLGLECLDLADKKLLEKIDLHSYEKKIDPERCWSHRLAPLYDDGISVVAAFANPLDHEGLKFLQFSLARPIKIVLAEELKIAKLLSSQFLLKSNDLSAFEDQEQTSTQVELISSTEREQNLDRADTDSPPIVRLCNKLLADAVSNDASDIHIEPSASALEVRQRIDGVMSKPTEIPKNAQNQIISRFKILSGMNITERRRPQDGRMHIKVLGQELDLRVSCIPAAHGEKLVFRLLRTAARDYKISDLAMGPQIEAAIKRILASRSKLLLTTGPTGSGKTTTLYTCLGSLKGEQLNIVTIEDPIEYRVAGINQIQVNTQAGITFASALRSVLRQDPDIIMVGEIRDSETAQMALQAAQTGHLVLSTLHTNDAPSAAVRLMNLGLEPYMIASSIGGILAQRLVRKLCPKCSTALSAEEAEKISDQAERFGLDLNNVHAARGCQECHQLGYKGRSAIFSYLEFNDQIGDLMLNRAPAAALAAAAKSAGYKSIEEAGIDLVNNGITTFEQILPYLPTSLAQPNTAKSFSGAFKIQATQKPDQPLQKQRILIVEDNEQIRSVFCMLLEREMFEVSEAKNGQEALEKIYKSTPTLILCDLMMPVMDGKEFLVRIRKHPETKQIPVVILTAVDNEENEIQLLELGASDFISKTSSTNVMLTRIRSVLARAG